MNYSINVPKHCNIFSGGQGPNSSGYYRKNRIVVMRNLQNLRAQIHDYSSFHMDAVAADLDSDFPFSDLNLHFGNSDATRAEQC